MKRQFIMFIENYTGDSGEKYHKNMKYKIQNIKDNYVYFSKDKIHENLRNKIYTIGDIVTNNNQSQ